MGVWCWIGRQVSFALHLLWMLPGITEASDVGVTGSTRLIRNRANRKARTVPMGEALDINDASIREAQGPPHLLRQRWSMNVAGTRTWPPSGMMSSSSGSGRPYRSNLLHVLGHD